MQISKNPFILHIVTAEIMSVDVHPYFQLSLEIKLVLFKKTSLCLWYLSHNEAGNSDDRVPDGQSTC